VPGAAVVRVSEITPFKAREIVYTSRVKGVDFTSAIGHDATAAAFSEILGTDVPVNRIHAMPEPGDIAVTLKVNGRLPEGVVLDADALTEIGYTLYLMEFYPSTAEIS